jgi:hypothetical protein
MTIIFPSNPGVQTPINEFGPNTTPLTNRANNTTYGYDAVDGKWFVKFAPSELETPYIIDPANDSYNINPAVDLVITSSNYKIVSGNPGFHKSTDWLIIEGKLPKISDNYVTGTEFIEHNWQTYSVGAGGNALNVIQQLCNCGNDSDDRVFFTFTEARTPNNRFPTGPAAHWWSDDNGLTWNRYYTPTMGSGAESFQWQGFANGHDYFTSNDAGTGHHSIHIGDIPGRCWQIQICDNSTAASANPQYTVFSNNCYGDGVGYLGPYTQKMHSLSNHRYTFFNLSRTYHNWAADLDDGVIVEGNLADRATGGDMMGYPRFRCQRNAEDAGAYYTTYCFETQYEFGQDPEACNVMAVQTNNTDYTYIFKKFINHSYNIDPTDLNAFSTATQLEYSNIVQYGVITQFINTSSTGLDFMVAMTSAHDLYKYDPRGNGGSAANPQQGTLTFIPTPFISVALVYKATDNNMWYLVSEDKRAFCTTIDFEHFSPVQTLFDDGVYGPMMYNNGAYFSNYKTKNNPNQEHQRATRPFNAVKLTIEGTTDPNLVEGGEPFALGDRIINYEGLEAYGTIIDLTYNYVTLFPYGGTWMGNGTQRISTIPGQYNIVLDDIGSDNLTQMTLPAEYMVAGNDYRVRVRYRSVNNVTSELSDWSSFHT